MLPEFEMLGSCPSGVGVGDLPVNIDSVVSYLIPQSFPRNSSKQGYGKCI